MRILSAFAAALLCASGAIAADAPLTRADVEGIVKEYIANNPTVLIDSLKQYQQKQMAQQQKEAGRAVADNIKALTGDAHSIVVGNPKGDVTVVEFYDYHCGYCKKMQPIVAQLIKDDPKVRVVFKEYPILSPDSELAAKASLAFHRLAPKKYFEYHSVLMNSKEQYTEAFLLAEAKKLGVDEAKLKAEMAKPEIAESIKETRELAGKIGVRGTPAFIVGEELTPGATSLEDLKKRIAEIRAEKKKK